MKATGKNLKSAAFETIKNSFGVDDVDMPNGASGKNGAKVRADKCILIFWLCGRLSSTTNM
jgi:hypothetical protein